MFFRMVGKYEPISKLQDPEGEIKKIATFLGKDIDKATVSAISDKCNFNNLKQAHENKNDLMKSKMKGGTGFMYRKGMLKSQRGF